MNNVKDFGAAGDGVANDTKAIQAAIDAGGVALIPPGVYICGTLYLRSNGGLHLEQGAVIRASHNAADYNADDYCPQNRVFREETVTGRHLITAVEQENISLTGLGRIDGDAFFWRHERDPHTKQFLPTPERPGQMIFFCECRNIVVQDVHLVNGVYWHLFLHGCEDVIIRGLRVTGEHYMATNDGIDVDCCKRVVISDCNINTGDDAITLRAYEDPLKVPRICEDVTVTNCVLTSFNDNAIRLGVGRGTIRNCVFSNIRITGSRTGFCFISRFSPQSMGSSIENIRCENISIGAHRPFNIKTSNVSTHPPMPNPAHIRNIVLNGLYAESDRCCFITGHPGSEVSGIHITNADFRFSGHGAAPDEDERGLWGYQSTDSVFTIRKAHDIFFENVRVLWEPDTDGWHHDVTSEESSGIHIKNCRFDKGTVLNQESISKVIDGMI